jgi:hypothetical protein
MDRFNPSSETAIFHPSLLQESRVIDTSPMQRVIFAGNIADG